MKKKRFYIQSPIMDTPLLWPLTVCSSRTFSDFCICIVNAKVIEQRHLLVSEKYCLKAVGTLVSPMIFMHNRALVNLEVISVKLRKNRALTILSIVHICVLWISLDRRGSGSCTCSECCKTIKLHDDSNSLGGPLRVKLFVNLILWFLSPRWP